MKKNLLLLISALLILSLGMSACDSDDEKVNEGKRLLETWELRTFDRGWGMVSTFNPNEVVCYIYSDGIIEVINKTDVSLSPFVNSGSYPFQVYTKNESKNFISINGIEYETQADKDNILHLYYESIESYYADGEKYDFVIIK